MKKYMQPKTIEVTLKMQGMIALSNGNEEGEGEYARKQELENERRSGFGNPIWSDIAM